jgi:hypothetical protein
MPATKLAQLTPSEWADHLEDVYGVERDELELFASAVAGSACRTLGTLVRDNEPDVSLTVNNLVYHLADIDWLEF